MFWKHFRLVPGGEPINLREQQDALEFFNSVVDSLDEALKALGQRPICQKIFGGQFADQKICKDCPHRYQIHQDFTSISVDVRNHSNLVDSLQEYVKGDLLESDNAYYCEKCAKKVDAIKRLCPKKLPEILAIQLKRFDFDWERETAVKFNDYFEFPRVLDMEPYTAQGLARREGETIEEEGELSPEVADSGVGSMLESDAGTDRQLYRLRGVIVHSGAANGGHYYSYISCPDAGVWYKFDDGEVTECDMENDEELRNQCFGGEFQNDNVDPYGKRMTPRRQKRWWSAYILVYERVESVEKTTWQMEQLSLNSRLRQMPANLEAIVRRKNMKFLHDRNQFTPEFFTFIRHLCQVNSPYIVQNLQADARHEESIQLAMLSVQLLSKFLFTTGLHARKALRGPTPDWLETMRGVLFCKEARLWFIREVLYAVPSRFSEYLMESPAAEVRNIFARILLWLMAGGRDDPAECLKLGAPLEPGESVSDLLIRTLLHLLTRPSSDCIRNVSQYFNLFYMYATQNGSEERLQLFRLGVPETLLRLCLEELPGTGLRSVFSELLKCYTTIAHLIRCCDVSHRCTAEKPSENPFAVRMDVLMKLPAEIESRLFSNEGGGFFKKLLECAPAHDETKNLIFFLCWDNLTVSKQVIKDLHWQLSYSYTELGPYLRLLLEVLKMEDGVTEARLTYTLKGSSEDREEGFLQELQEERAHGGRKSYLIIKLLTQLFEESQIAVRILEDSLELKKQWVHAFGWLHGEIERRPFPHYTYASWNVQSNESSQGMMLERTNSAKNILERAYVILNSYCIRNGHLMQNEEEENSEEDMYEDAVRGSTAQVPVPSDPPPAYDPQGMVHSRSASAGLEMPTTTQQPKSMETQADLRLVGEEKESKAPPI